MVSVTWDVTNKEPGQPLVFVFFADRSFLSIDIKPAFCNIISFAECDHGSEGVCGVGPTIRSGIRSQSR